MTITLSRKFADFTLRWNPDEKRSYDSLVYQYAVMVNFLAIAALTLIIGLINGQLSATLTAGASFMALRVVSGGFHFKSLDLCAVVTATIYGVIPSVHVSADYIIWINAVSLVLVALLAPTNLRNTMWTSKAGAKMVFKAAAICVVLIGWALGSETVALALLAQALLLIPRKGVAN
ncbi:accessory gene regulator B family protein [Paenibacillus planticolens]|uniref:Accessory gene regulator B n=1 Tax=Paenibacillus planticolens TaxID=2654976 RepID=A0ABX1ZEA6_9BACL|nr:accessory gene regulator B family protein [Paenibacillus planticolens]NOU98433.1 hypothetical protein [Paenibacillus planticolens]